MIDDKRTNNDLQNITQKSKDRVTRTSLKTGDEFRCYGMVSSSYHTSVTHYSSDKSIMMLLLGTAVSRVLI